MGPVRKVDKRGEVVGDNNFSSSDLVDSGNTSKLSNGSFSGVRYNSVKNEFFFAVAEMVSIFTSFSDLDNHIKIFSVNSCGKNAENAG